MLDAYFVDSCTYYAAQGKDEWQEPDAFLEYDFDHKCFIYWKTRKVTDRNGKEVVSTAQILFDQDYFSDTIGRLPIHRDRIKLDGESYDRKIIQISRPKPFSTAGGGHLEIALQ